MTTSQNAQIERDLLRGKRLTWLDALHKYNCSRLAARISDLRAKGLRIKTESVKTDTGKHIARYYIDKQDRKVAS